MGVGDSPIGSGPFGTALPATAVAPSPFTKKDPRNGNLLTGRYIDPKTGRYVFDSTGRIIGMGSVPQLVLLAYATRKGSSVLPDLGDAPGAQTIGDEFRKQFEIDAIAPIQSLIDSGQLEVIEVTVDRIGSDGIVRRVRWRDLTTGLIQTTQV